MKNQCKLDVSAIQIILKRIAQNPLRDSLKYFPFFNLASSLEQPSNYSISAADSPFC